MKLRQFLSDEDAVSPVIGVILMVAITVILAAVIGSFVLGLGDQVNETAPQASFSFEYETGSPNNLTITHESGDAIDAARVTIVGGGLDANWSDGTGSAGQISAGDSTTFDSDGDLDVSSGDTVRVVWTSQSGSTSATIQSWTYEG
ncbi:hypothetical protein C440_14839 [Haloferax mucosum ATCC BAA-1512]|uniref:Archaeal Type IV pilin N-terminal domain-containing protein n=1 Tax=Haloferax mucosum ATCC BAA-1512 TaxID=662479 RepID=M0I497_9EURY|nr:type IV pilin N-terminal domain-containing protein [Haloferax mucosum]ELZ91600.1 hypothetical protein C440_14839 [Haloferax mucosum ATCC BAA-1512]